MSFRIHHSVNSNIAFVSPFLLEIFFYATKCVLVFVKTFSFFLYDVFLDFFKKFLACSQGSDFGTGRSFGRGTGGRMGGGRGFGDSRCLFYIHIFTAYDTNLNLLIN